MMRPFLYLFLKPICKCHLFWKSSDAHFQAQKIPRQYKINLDLILMDMREFVVTNYSVSVVA